MFLKYSVLRGQRYVTTFFDMAREHDINAVIQGMHIADIALKARTDPGKLCQIATFSLSEHFINLVLQRVFFDTWPRNRSSKKSPQMCTQIIVSPPYSISDKILMYFLLSKSMNKGDQLSTY